MDQDPTRERWSLVPLYKEGANGLLVWEVSFNGVELVFRRGYEEGVNQYSTREVVPKSNRTLGEQALLEARQRYKEKYLEGYQPGGSTQPSLKKGMKGHPYKNNVKSWPVFTQPKLNGIRMLANCSAGKVSCRSWLNNYYTHLSDISRELSSLFAYLPHGTTVDGELYNHEMDFTSLCSAVKTVKEVHSDLSKVEYWIFDVDYLTEEGHPHSEERVDTLRNAFSKYSEECSPVLLRLVPTEICSSHEEMLERHSKHVKDGYEGIMIKKRANGKEEDKESIYRAGKSNNILKYKEFMDEEAVIVDVVEAEGTEKGAAMMVVRDVRGNSFPVRMRGSVEQRREWFKNRERVLGKEVTIRYQELSVYGVPRFPVGVCIRDYE